MPPELITPRRKRDGGGQTGSFPFSEVASHYEPNESCETNVRKRSACPRFPGEMDREGRGGGGGQDQGTSSLVKKRTAEGPTVSKTKDERVGQPPESPIVFRRLESRSSRDKLCLETTDA